jgi:hypothetical protein
MCGFCNVCVCVCVGVCMCRFCNVPFPAFASYTLTFVLKLRKKHGKPTVINNYTFGYQERDSFEGGTAIYF